MSNCAPQVTDSQGKCLYGQIVWGCKTMRFASSEIFGVIFAFFCVLQIVGPDADMRNFSLDYNDNVLTRLLLAFVILSQLFISLIYASSNPFDDHVNSEINNPNEWALDQPVVRLFKLQNQCSKSWVQIINKNVDARGRTPLIATIRSESTTFGSRVTLQSNQSLKFLCFNRRGRLTVRHSRRGNSCVFIERIDNGQTIYQSVANNNWFLGFRKNGKPLKGYQWRGKKSMACYKFQKTSFPKPEWTPQQLPPSSPWPGFGELNRSSILRLLTQKHDKT